MTNDLPVLFFGFQLNVADHVLDDINTRSLTVKIWKQTIYRMNNNMQMYCIVVYLESKSCQHL